MFTKMDTPATRHVPLQLQHRRPSRAGLLDHLGRVGGAYRRRADLDGVERPRGGRLRRHRRFFGGVLGGIRDG